MMYARRVGEIRLTLDDRPYLSGNLKRSVRSMWLCASDRSWLLIRSTVGLARLLGSHAPACALLSHPRQVFFGWHRIDHRSIFGWNRLWRIFDVRFLRLNGFFCHASATHRPRCCSRSDNRTSVDRKFCCVFHQMN